jgi:hypothetical protein
MRTVKKITIVNKIQQDAPVLKSFKKTLLFSFILLYMFRALLCPSSGASTTRNGTDIQQTEQEY